MQGVIEKVAILILDSCGCVVERYVINLRVSMQKPHMPGDLSGLKLTWNV